MYRRLTHDREAVLQALQTRDYNRKHTAATLGIARASLYRVVRRMNIPLPPSKYGTGHRGNWDNDFLRTT